jgi:hypothetical protein
MRSCYATFLSLLLLSLCATAADPQSAKLSSPPPAGSSWVQEATLTNTIGCCLNAKTVAINGNTVAVSPGAVFVYVYVKPTSGWHGMTQTAILSPSNPSTAFNFGSSIAIAGNTIVVGSNQATVGSNALQGALYVYVEPAGGWTNMTETAILTASDGGAGDFLGNSVGISGNTIVAGAPFHNHILGAAYVFVEPVGGWVTGTQTAELTGSTGANASEVGAKVAISGGTVAAGAGLSSLSGSQGGALVFVKPLSGWSNMTQNAVLGTGQLNLSAGESIATSGDTVALGTPFVTANGNVHAGGVFVWVRPGAGWANMSPTAELTASDGKGNDYVGESVSTNGTAIVAGAPQATVGSNREQGAVYVFNKPASGWTNMTESAKITSFAGTPANLFGFSVGISGGTMVVGAPFINSETGAAYIFGQ